MIKYEAGAELPSGLVRYVPGTGVGFADEFRDLVEAEREKPKSNRWELDRRKIMEVEEVGLCSQYLDLRARTSPSWRFKEQVFLLLVGCGLRSCEVSGVRIGDVRLTQPRPFVHVERGKGSKTGSVPIPWSWAVGRMGVFLKWRLDEFGLSESCDPWIVGMQKRQAVGTKRIQAWFKECLAPLPYERQRELASHSGRHTAATTLLNNGHTVATVQRFLRHASISSTMVYLHGQDLLPGDLYGRGGEECADEQLSSAWSGERTVGEWRRELEELAFQTPDGSFVEGHVTSGIEKEWRQKELYGVWMDRMLKCYRILGMAPSLYGDYHEDRSWRAVVVWRWLSWSYYRKELDFHYGQERSPAIAATDGRSPARRGECVDASARV
jgi:hypothetical protein